MAEGSRLNGYALFAAVAGSILLYSGLKGKGISGVFQSLIAGQNPSSAPQTLGISGTDLEGSLATGVTPAGTVTYQSFWTAVLQNIGRPVTAGNLEALAGISKFEGLNNYWNPMNIEYHGTPSENPILKGVGNWNSVGVQEYADADSGIAATSAFLLQPHWAGLMTALAAGNFQLDNAAIKQAYTWAAYSPPSQTAADQILALPMGQTTGTGYE